MDYIQCVAICELFVRLYIDNMVGYVCIKLCHHSGE